MFLTMPSWVRFNQPCIYCMPGSISYVSCLACRRSLSTIICLCLFIQGLLLPACVRSQSTRSQRQQFSQHLCPSGVFASYSPFMMTAAPMPPANMQGTVMKDSRDINPIPDKPWPLQQHQNKSVSNWISTSCQPHRVTSGQSNSIISKFTFQHFSSPSTKPVPMQT